MKNWIIIYINGGVQSMFIDAKDVMQAIYSSGLPQELIVSVQCVNTQSGV